MKDWLINKLGGHTRDEMEKIILEKGVIHKRHESDMKVLEEVSKKLAETEKSLEKERQSRLQAQEELERLRMWRAQVRVKMRRENIPHHTVNAILNLKGKR